MPYINTLTRRDFLNRALRTGAGLGVAALLRVPPFAGRALAEGSVGLNGKKLLFIFLRGANDALNSCIPVKDDAFTASLRPNIWIPQDPTANFYDATTGGCEFHTGEASTFAHTNALRLGNGFAALHPSLKFLAPVYNAGDLVMVHRVGYANQSRSHFNSQAYWENGQPNSSSREGIFFRTLVESGVLATNPIAGVSIQSALPTIFKGRGAALTNLSDPTRYKLLGTPTPGADLKLANSMLRANQAQFATKRSRDLLQLSYQNLSRTLDLFAAINFDESGNTFTDDVATDIGSTHYPLFPTSAAKNGGGTTATQVVDGGAYGFFEQLKAAALILNKTNAVIAGTEMGDFDTHDNQGGLTGDHANLQSRIGWAIYALRKYFQNYGDKVSWNNLVVVTLTEFGRTTAQNSNSGTDHAEAGLMWIAGGGVKGLGKAGRASGVIGCGPSDPIPWTTGPAGVMFGVQGRYLRRAVDYRSVLGEIIRDHLGATQNQLNSIIPGYAIGSENLLGGGLSSVDQTQIMGEVDVV
jgi:uncharacterized protein (DUF1501 family)